MACQFNDVGFDLPNVTVVPNKKRLCVAHQFNACPNGDYCIFTHEENVDGVAEERDWSELLRTDETAVGATWKDADGPVKPAFTLKREMIRPKEQPAKERPIGSSGNRKVALLAISVLSLASLAATIAYVSRRRKS
eukprot:GDKK01020272.1.p1 GENE.GDKK01020272.1~~GDKK01020272.1.p1  ORF type:complete len:136 (+),score=1.13 GDKK01020272.1:1-408(+)